jgi:hypothetical protein
MTSREPRTTGQRINRIRQRLCDGLSGFQQADVQALMDEYERIAAELAEERVLRERMTGLFADTEHALQGTGLHHWFATQVARMAVAE